MLEYRGTNGYMSWRELGEAISQLPEEVLDFDASVWLPQDVVAFDEFQGFTSLGGFDLEQEISSDNPPSLSTGR